MALGSITEGPDKQKFLEVIVQALQNLLQMFKDTNGKVREAISWVMSRICEHHADVLTNEQIIHQFMICIIGAMSDKPRISNQCCSAIEKLSQSCEPTNYHQQRSNALTPYFKDTISSLMQNSQREDYAGTGVDLVQASYVAMTSLVQNSCSDSNDVIYELMIPILQTLEQTLNLNVMSLEKANHMQDALCGLIQVILIKVGTMVEKPLAANIVQVIISLFKQAEKVTENGLIAF